MATYNVFGLNWDSNASLGTKQSYIATLLERGVTPDQLKGKIAELDPANANDAVYDLLGIPKAAPSTPTFTPTATVTTTPTGTGNVASTDTDTAVDTPVETITVPATTSPPQFFNFFGQQWDTQASLAQKQQYVQNALNQGVSVDQIRQAISTADPVNATEANLTLLGAAKPIVSAPTGGTTTGTTTGGTTTGTTYNVLGTQWNTAASLDAKQKMVQQMLGGGATAEQIRAKILELDPASATAQNFQLLGIPAPTTATQPPANLPGADALRDEALALLRSGNSLTNVQSQLLAKYPGAVSAISTAVNAAGPLYAQSQPRTTDQPAAVTAAGIPTGTGITTQFVREAPEVEAYKLGLMQRAQQLGSVPYALPEFQVAGLTPQQAQAAALAQTGIGAYLPYLGAGQESQRFAMASGIQPATQELAGLKIPEAFAPAQAAMAAAQPGITSIYTQASPEFTKSRTELGLAGTDVGGIAGAAAPRMTQAEKELAAAGTTTGGVAGAAASGLQGGIGALSAAQQALTGTSAAYSPAAQIGQFMNPYQQQVIDEAIKQINRQGDIARQNIQAQAVRAGAFGGSREGIQRAELERNLAEQRNAAIVGALQQGYGQALGASQQAFEQAQQRALAGAGQQAAIGSQYGQLGTQAANVQAQQAQLQQQLGAQYGQLGTQQANILAQQAAQRAALAGQYGTLGTQQAGTLAQQAQLQQQLGQGIGALTSQELQTALQRAAGMGQLGTQAANIGVQQAALGEAAQRMGQTDVQNLFGIGEAQRQLQQQQIEAQRQTALQNIYQPYQQLGLVGDIYKGAPTSQMATSITQQQQQSPFMQALGLGIGAISTAAAANKLF